MQDMHVQYMLEYLLNSSRLLLTGRKPCNPLLWESARPHMATHMQLGRVVQALGERRHGAVEDLLFLLVFWQAEILKGA